MSLESRPPLVTSPSQIRSILRKARFRSGLLQAISPPMLTRKSFLALMVQPSP